MTDSERITELERKLQIIIDHLRQRGLISEIPPAPEPTPEPAPKS